MGISTTKLSRKMVSGYLDIVEFEDKIWAEFSTLLSEEEINNIDVDGLTEGQKELLNLK